MKISGQRIFWGSLGLCAALAPAYLYGHLQGPDVRHSGAPGDVANSCATSQCHTDKQAGGTVNANGGKVTAVFSTGTSYIPGGSPITITVTVTDPVNTRYGFQMTARLTSNLVNGQAGTFTPNGTHQIVLCDDNNLRPAKGCAASNPVEFIEHFFNMATPSQVTTTPYTFTWTPPTTNVGNVQFYVAGNAVNGDNNDTGSDHVYTASYTLAPGVSNPPTIVTGGVLNAASFAKGSDGLGTPVAPGSLVSIFASNYGTQQAGASTVPFPLTLGGVASIFGGVMAPLRDVVPAAGLINVQIPFGTKTGTTSAVISTSGGPSAALPVTIVAQAPGIFTNPPGVGTAILVSLPEFTLVTAAKPISRGASAFFYATGLGVMTPPVTDGDGGLDGVTHFAMFPTVTIGGFTAQVGFAGQAPGFPGVYQVNITIPTTVPIGSNDMRIISADGSQKSPAGVATIYVQ